MRTFFTSKRALSVYASFCTDIAAGLVLSLPLVPTLADLTYRASAAIMLLVIAIGIKNNDNR